MFAWKGGGKGGGGGEILGICNSPHGVHPYTGPDFMRIEGAERAEASAAPGPAEGAR